MTDPPISTADLLDRIRTSWDGFQSAVSARGDGRLDVVTQNGWSLKDHLAHVAGWEGYLLAVLERRDALAVLGVPPGAGETEANEALLARHAGDSPEAVRELSERTHAELMRLLGELGDEGLARPLAHYRHEVDPRRPVLDLVLGNTVGHYDEHRGWVSA